MRASRIALLVMLPAAMAGHAAGQVLAPVEIKDPVISGLQQSYLKELHEISAALAMHHFPHSFYLSRQLDLTEKEQAQSDQRSIQFDRFRGQVVLKITGNYFAAYPAGRMTKEERARQTFNDVMLPILQSAAPALAHADVPDAFALEISHHVVGKVLGVDNEAPENVVLILPKASAKRLMEAHDEAGRIAAVLEGAAYLNGLPVSFWPDAVQDSPVTTLAPAPPAPSTMPQTRPPAPIPTVTATAKLPVAPAPPASVPPSTTSADVAARSASLEDEYHDTIVRLKKDLDPQAHFVAYAPPSFISFRDGQYLQIPITTTLTASDDGSQYKLAALAFDRHIAHLIRQFRTYFKDSPDFAGIDFSTTIHLSGASADAAASESVEFIFPLSAMRSYAQFDLTGQQLLNAGFVLINGERAGLDLQIDEATAQPPR